MATLKMSNMVMLVVLAAAGILICSNNIVVRGQQWQCNGDFQGMINECSSYVRRSGPIRDPSEACCREFRTFRDPSCLCNYITEPVQQIIDMAKAVYVARFCGEPFRSGTQCGSYTVP